MTFEEYLTSKKIDSALFQEKEKALWQEWKAAFDQMHPNSFTVQKLNLINPIRRKYQLKVTIPVTAPAVESPATPETKAPASAPGSPAKAVMKPVFKPKPKIN